MSRWLALADGVVINTQTPTDNMTQPNKTPDTQPKGAFCQVLSNCQMGSQDKIAPISAQEMRHGFALNGHPKTWTGNIVSLNAWRQLTEWDKHGPDGRIWCVVCKGWLKQCEHINACRGTTR